MRLAAFSARESCVIGACRDAGVVVEFFVVDCNGQDTHSEWTHRCAAVAAVKAACIHAAREILCNVEPLIGDDRSREDELRGSASDATARWQAASRQATDPAALKGRRLSLCELYGEAYDPDGGSFDESKARFAREVFDPEWSLGDAFACTPYGVCVRGHELEPLWSDVVTELLRRPDRAATLFRWDGDWSPYFDAGREWWGAAAWTIRRSADQVLVACASTTD